jgi:hypothetical protein
MIPLEAMAWHVFALQRRHSTTPYCGALKPSDRNQSLMCEPVAGMDHASLALTASGIALLLVSCAAALALH